MEINPANSETASHIILLNPGRYQHRIFYLNRLKKKGKRHYAVPIFAITKASCKSSLESFQVFIFEHLKSAIVCVNMHTHPPKTLYE